MGRLRYNQCAGEYYLKKVVLDQEKCNIMKVGRGNVKKIIYHEPVGDGDRHYVDVYCDDVHSRIFKFDGIVFMEETE